MGIRYFMVYPGAERTGYTVITTLFGVVHKDDVDEG